MVPSAHALLSKAGIPAVLITNLANIRYLTGLDVSSGYVLAMGKSCTFFVSDLYLEMAVHEARQGVKVKPLAELERTMKKTPLCGFEEEHVTVAQLRSWKTKFPLTKFSRTSGLVEEYRRSKDADELKHLRRADRITEELLRRVPSALHAGITERSLARKIETWAYELGAERMSFPTIVAFGSHTSHPHHHPGSRALQKGHIVQIDVGAVFKGYCADRSQVYFTSQPTKAEQRAYQAVEEAKNAAIDAVAPGVSTCELDRIARDVLKSYGMEAAFTHTLGHGVGLDVHEGVILSVKRPDQALLKGEVITIEPGVYFPGKFGIRLEEMVIVA